MILNPCLKCAIQSYKFIGHDRINGRLVEIHECAKCGTYYVDSIFQEVVQPPDMQGVRYENEAEQHEQWLNAYNAAKKS